jgi:hypothetical protein
MRNLVVCAMVAILPVSLFAQDAATLRSSSSGVLVNGNSSPALVTLFVHDTVRTSKELNSNLELSGSAAAVAPDTMFTFERNELVLDHGTLSVTTSRFMRVRIGCITVIPVHQNLTHYEVHDVDGKVRVSALTDDVYIEMRSGKPQDLKDAENKHSTRTIVREGEQKTREEKCGGADVPTPDGKDGILNSPWAIGFGTAAITGVTCWALCSTSNPMSPDKPK